MRRYFFRLLFAALALAVLPQAALADLAGGKRALAKQDYATAQKEFEIAAKRGSAEGMYLLGTMYSEGQGMAQDEVRGFELIQKAATADYTPAQSMLARLYAGGRGVTRDNEKSIQWARRAADKGDPLSQYIMGLRSAEGWGVPKDPQEALLWFGASAEQGFAPAQFSLGMLAGFGPAAAPEAPGSRQNRIEGAKWLALAARQKFPELKDTPETRLAELRAKMSPDEIREATERVRKWQPVKHKPKPKSK